jgi:excisionase family DNA binding protein
MNETYYTLQEIADRLKVNYRTVYRWVRADKLPAYKFGSEWRVAEADMEKFIEERRTPRS